MNYQNLYSNVLDYLARDDISFGLFDTWLRIVEKKLDAKLEAWSDYTITTIKLENGIAKLPDDFKKGVVVKIGQYGYVLQYKTPQAFEEKVDVVGYFTIKNNQLLVSGNLNDVELSVEYNSRIKPLSDDNPENAISINYPDLYLSGVLKESALWNKDSAMLQLHTINFEEALNEANRNSVAMAMSGSQLVMSSDINFVGRQ